MNDLIGLIAGFALTLFIYSYLVGDNPLYRIAVHILVGVSAAYAAVIAVRHVFVPIFIQIRDNPSSTESLLWLVPIALGLLLILKRLPSLSWLGDGAVAYLVGAGAAVALVGAIVGTLWPQVMSADAATPLLGLLVAVLTAVTLLAFQFTGRPSPDGVWQRPLWLRAIVFTGQTVIMITFGALFAGIFSSSLVLLAERLNYFMTQFMQLLT